MNLISALKTPLCGVLVASVAIVATTPTPASAQFRNFGRAAGAVAGAAVVLGVLGSMQQGRAAVPRGSSRQSGNRRGRSDSNSESSSSSGTPAVQQTAVSAATRARNVAQQEAETQAIIASNNMESDRNLQSALKAFIEDLRRRHQGLLGGGRNVKVATGVDINEVTEGSLRTAVEDAYRVAGLAAFERFSGEMWTRDRLTVFILRHARQKLPPYFVGAGARGPDMNELRLVLANSARSVFATALETSELMGVSHSFDRFIRTIYENSDRADGSLWTTGADGRYEKLMSDLIERVPLPAGAPVGAADSSGQSVAVQGVGRQFLARFRARRALYDCMSSSYPNLLGNRATMGRGPLIQTSGAAAGGDGGTDQAAAEATPLDDASAALRTEQVWRRMQQRVAQTCSNRVPEIVRLVASGEFRPQPVRFDSSQGGVGADVTTVSREGMPMRLPGE